ncbi:MAG: putative Ig domain-containing protein [Campylobacterota bacterium]|nr:putative Ig domain-containing protein [Campylobacterota bacterium]
METLAKIYLENGTNTSINPYIIANNNTKIKGTSSDLDCIKILEGVRGTTVSSTIESVELVGKLNDYKFKQGFGSNIEVYENDGTTLVLTMTDIDDTLLTFSDGTIQLAYNETNNIISLGGIEITQEIKFLDITAPTMLSATVLDNGTSIVITYDEGLESNQYTQETTDYTITLSDGSTIPVIDIVTSSTISTLTLGSVIYKGITISSINYSFDANTKGTIIDSIPDSIAESTFVANAAQNQSLEVDIINDSLVIDDIAPIIETVSILSSNQDTALAKAGDTITITFTTDGTNSGVPIVTIVEKEVIVENLTNQNEYKATYTLEDGDIEGLVTFDIVASDLSGNIINITAPTDESCVTFDNTAPIFTTINNIVDTVDEDTQIEISFDDISTQGDQVDTTTSIVAYTVSSVLSGTLLIGENLKNAIEYNATTNNIIDNTHFAYWIPAQDVHGEIIDAFIIQAVDSLGHISNTDVSVQINVIEINDTPIVTTSILDSSTDEDRLYSYDTSTAFTDIDTKDILTYTATLNDETSLPEWLTIDSTTGIISGTPENKDVGILAIKVTATDSSSEMVSDTFELTINNTNTAPTLDIATEAGDSANKIELSISGVPDDAYERVALTFENISEDITIVDENGVNITNSISDFKGIHNFTILLPQDKDVDNNISIKLTSYDDANNELAYTSQNIDINYDITTARQNINFTSEKQNMWSSTQNNLIEWHEYIPILGDISQVWDSQTKEWIINEEALAWSSGEMNIIDINIDSQEIIAQMKAESIENFSQAQDTFNRTSVAVDEVAYATFQTAQEVFNTAAIVIDTAVTNTLNTAQTAFDNAKDVYDDLSSSFNSTVQSTFDTATTKINSVRADYQSAYDKAIVAQKAYDDSAYTVLGVTFHGVSEAAAKIAAWAVEVKELADLKISEGIYTLAQSVYDKAKTSLDTAAETLTKTATNALNTAQTNFDNAVQDAQNALLETFENAQATYDNVKQNIFDTAQGILDTAHAIKYTSLMLIDNIDFNSQIKLDTTVSAQVGVLVDFVLDLGSVDTDIDYNLSSLNQYNQTTDLLTIMPTMTNLTKGEDIAYNTISPNATFDVALLYDVSAAVDIFIDESLVLKDVPAVDLAAIQNLFLNNGTIGDVLTTEDRTIFDLSPDSDGITISKYFSTSSEKNNDTLTIEEKEAIGKLVLIEYDSTNSEPYEVPFIEDKSDDILSIELALPTVETQGVETNYSEDFYKEGDLINIDFAEISDLIFDKVNAKLDYSDEMKDLYGLESLSNETLESMLASSQEIVTGTLKDMLDGQSESVPIFVIENEREANTALVHINNITDDLSTLNDDTANFGFYTSFGKSEPIVKVNVDIDQLVAVIVNNILTAGASTTADIPIVNPLDLAFGIEELVEMLPVSDSIAEKVTDYIDFSVGFELADIDVYAGIDFSQEFSLSIDDMSYLVTLENGVQKTFNANKTNSIDIQNASLYDTNNDGSIAYSMEIVPTAMFSNDTEAGLNLGYSMDFLQGSLSAGFMFPIEGFIGEVIETEISAIDINLGPLLSITGDLDVLSADIFEDRFELDVGAATINGQNIGITDDTMFIA